MSEGVDYSSSSIDEHALAAAGKHFAGRYVGPGSSGKHLTAAERDQLFAAGLGIFLNVEGAGGDCLLGAAKGREHAASALAACRSLDVPYTVALYAAYDRDDHTWSTTQWAAVEAYAAAFRDGVGAARAGCYGSVRLVKRLRTKGLAARAFQTYAWSVGQWWSGNDVEQYHNGVWLAGGQVDLCRSRVVDFGQWSKGDDDMTPAQAYVQHVINYRVEATIAMRDPIHVPAFTAPDGTTFPAIDEPNQLAQAVRAIPTTAGAVDLVAVAKAAHDGAAEGINGATINKAP